MAITQDGRVGELITPLGKDVLVLHRFDGHEGLGEPFEFHVDALSEQENIDFDKAIGQSHTIKLETYQGKTRIIDGILTEAQGVDQIRDNYHYRLVLRPWFSLLGYKSDSRTYLNKNVKEILQRGLHQDPDSAISSSRPPPITTPFHIAYSTARRIKLFAPA